MKYRNVMAFTYLKQKNAFRIVESSNSLHKLIRISKKSKAIPITGLGGL
jgi:hypothetical protein